MFIYLYINVPLFLAQFQLIFFFFFFSQSAGAVEYTDCFSAEG